MGRSTNLHRAVVRRCKHRGSAVGREHRMRRPPHVTELQIFAVQSYDAARTEAPSAENTAKVMTSSSPTSVRRHPPVPTLQIKPQHTRLQRMIMDVEAANGVRSNSQACWSTETRNGEKDKRGRDVVETPTQACSFSASIATRPLKRAGFTMKSKERSQGRVATPEKIAIEQDSTIPKNARWQRRGYKNSK